jgi:hypothetical protein
MLTHPAGAMFVDQSGGSGADASLEAVEGCGSEGEDCTSISMWVDPVSTGVSSFHLALAFDPAKFTFDSDPDLSGPFCGFSAGGPCPPPRASLGTSPIRQDDTQPGNPPVGSTLTTSVFDLENGMKEVVIDYTVPTPVDLSSDQNVFALGFDLVTPIPAGVPLFASYFGTPGAHDFNQIAFSCNVGATPCAGQPPIVGVDISRTIPEPTSAVILGVALLMLWFASTRYWGSSMKRLIFTVFSSRAHFAL